MIAAAERAGAAAVARLVARMVALVAEELPDVTAEPADGGVRLTGPRLRMRQVEDVRLRALALQAARSMP